VSLTPQGQIQVNERFETNVEGIYAIGVVIPGPMLAHRADKEAIAVAENFKGQSCRHFVYNQLWYPQS